MILVKDARKEWLMDVGIEGRSPATVHFYTQFTQPFAAKLGEIPMDKLTSTMVKQYLADAQDGHDFAHHARYRALRRFLNYCVKEKYIESSPLNLRMPTLPEPVIPDFSREEIKAMLKACQGTMALRDMAMILLMYDTGIRLGEMPRMKLEDVNLVGHQLLIHGKGKRGKKDRLLHLSDATVKAIWTYLKSRKKQADLVWLSEESRPIDSGGIYQAVKRVIRRAGIQGRKASPHVFRHTFASQFLQSGGGMDELQYLLGHESMAMVERYARFSKAKRAIESQARHSPVDSL
ncbi:MAG: tyrosine-type recombinase/integrase [Dehalococcoidia bacterium]